MTPRRQLSSRLIFINLNFLTFWCGIYKYIFHFGLKNASFFLYVIISSILLGNHDYRPTLSLANKKTKKIHIWKYNKNIETHSAFVAAIESNTWMHPNGIHRITPHLSNLSSLSSLSPRPQITKWCDKPRHIVYQQFPILHIDEKKNRPDTIGPWWYGPRCGRARLRLPLSPANANKHTNKRPMYRISIM